MFDNSIIYIDEFAGFTEQEYNIIKKDSTIIEIKKQFENEKDNIINMSDSTIIDLFTKLANE